MNKVFLYGNLGADPELRTAKTGNSVCNLSVATNERDKVNGEWADHTEWHNVVVFGNQATTCGENLSKGSRVLVEGRVRKRSYTDKQGQERQRYEVIATRVEFGSRGSAKPPGQGTSASSEYGAVPAWTPNDSDIPF